MSNSLCFSFNDGFIAIVEFTEINNNEKDERNDSGFALYLIGIIVGVIVIIALVTAVLCWAKDKWKKR